MNDNISCATQRPKKAEVTSGIILQSARRRFLQESYESVGLRDIARDAGVDVALVSRYFGSKESLFREVLAIGSKGEILPPALADRDIPAFLARLFLEQGGDEGNEHVERMLIMLRSASSPIASQIVRETLKHDILLPLAERLDGEAPEVRASLSMAVWMGMTILRTVMSVRPLCDNARDIAPYLEKLFEAALLEGRPSNV
jgi:AcrR family transcriptional regulator